MDTESDSWPRWEAAFRALAEKAQLTKHTAQIKGARHYLCLYGDNGLTEDQEFEELVILETHAASLQRVEVDSDLWQDTILFVV